MTDPERLDEEIESIEPDIEFEYGKNYNELTTAQKEEVINDHFFIANPNIKRSHPLASREIRITLDAYRQGDIPAQEVRVTTINRGGTFLQSHKGRTDRTHKAMGEVRK